MRNAVYFLCLLFLAACAHRKDPLPADTVPLDQRLAQFVALHNSGKLEELRSHFTQNATIQSPLTPRPSGINHYLRALGAEPYQLSFGTLEVIYSLPGRAATRCEMTATAPGRFNLREAASIEWRLEDGYWRIARIAIPGWASIVGTWRRSGLRNEGSIELRILPDRTYLIYTAEDYSAPEYRGRYRLTSNKITFADISANDPRNFQSAEGSYIFVNTPTGMTLRKIEEGNTWRTDRFEGAWNASR